MLKKKWRDLGLQLKLTTTELKHLETKHFRESFSRVLSMWEKKGSVDQTFTWKTFFAALSSDNIKEKKAMENILSKL